MIRINILGLLSASILGIAVYLIAMRVGMNISEVLYGIISGILMQMVYSIFYTNKIGED